MMTSEHKYFLFCSRSHEEGGRNKTETTGQIYLEQVCELQSIFHLYFRNCLVGLALTIFFHRLKKGKQLEKEEAISEVKKNIHLIKAPHAGESFFFNFEMTAKDTKKNLKHY